jgi:hypothetical protein
VHWLHVEKIEVCSKCQKVRAVGSSFPAGVETKTINRNELLKKTISTKEKEEEQEYGLIVEEQHVAVTST